MSNNPSSYFFLLLLLVAIVAAISIFLPFLAPVLLAAAAAVIAHPVFYWIKFKLGDGRWKRTFSALLTVLFVLLVILVPFFFLVQTIYGEVQVLYGYLIDEGNRSEIIDLLNDFWSTLSTRFIEFIPDQSFDSFNITEMIKSVLQWLFSHIDTVFGSLATVAGYAFIFLMALFYFLRDGASLKKAMISWNPILSKHEDYITLTFKRAIRSVFAGTLAVALLEGISTGLAFLVFGIPAPALWGTLAALAALLPGIGVPMIVLPAVAYLILTGNYAYAVGLFIWGNGAIMVIDNILGPILINRGVNIHPFLILLSVLGGLVTFGIIGLFMGPLILVLLFTMLEIYRATYKVTE